MGELDPVGGDADISWAARASALAFGGGEAGCREWLEVSGHENIRLLREEGEVAASLIVIPMGQYFGGQSVAMEGIAGVAVPPESRGRGAARRLMAAQVRDAAAAGIPLSCLYCSTQMLYRQVGYEQAGVLFRHNMPLRTMGVRDRSMGVRVLGEADEGDVRRCYAEFASRYDGMLDRGPYIWQRARAHRGEAYSGFGFGEDAAGGGALESYLYLIQRRDAETGRYDVVISDMAFTTARGGRRLLGFLSDQATVGDDAVFYGPGVHPLMALLPQQYFSSVFKDMWMVRVNRVKEALEARGYASGIDTTVRLEVTDELVEQNAGVWTLRVREGRAEVERGGSGDGPVVRCDVLGLAAMYSGYCNATQGAGVGWVEGDAAALAAADGVFGGGGAWMVDQF